jgi:hypothetical protein
MATTFCRLCGAKLIAESKFCANCGQPIYEAPTATQRVSRVTEVSIPPSTPPSQLAPSSRLGAAFWLGLIGAVFGMLFGLFLLVLGSIGQGSPELIIRSVLAIIFSILAIVGGLRIIDERDTINAGLMMLAGVCILLAASVFGLFSASLFFIGGALIMLKKG